MCSPLMPTSWRITPRRPSIVIVPPVGASLTGDQPQQRRLADAVGADERDPLAVADGEADVAQQLGAARTSPADVARPGSTP